MLRFDKILCPVDFEQNSLRALRVAAELAQERKATLYLLHVVGVPPGSEVALSDWMVAPSSPSRLGYSPQPDQEPLVSENRAKDYQMPYIIFPIMPPRNLRTDRIENRNVAR